LCLWEGNAESPEAKDRADESPAELSTNYLVPGGTSPWVVSGKAD
jgi:hypothetical protein